MQYRNEITRAGNLLHDVSLLGDAIFERFVASTVGMTRPQWWVMSQLFQNDAEGIGMAQNKLARLIGVSKGALGKMIDRLEKIGYAQRTADLTDRRFKCVTLTPRGLQAILQTDQAGGELSKQIMRGISDKELAEMSENLNKIMINMGEMLAAPPPPARRATSQRAPRARSEN